jgi:hypothetical protein
MHLLTAILTPIGAEASGADGTLPTSPISARAC